jgi:hypothetical protein
MLAYSQFFYLVHTGQGRWAIRHRITDEPAGAVERSGPAFEVYDDRDHLVATSDTIEHALAELYATA